MSEQTKIYQKEIISGIRRGIRTPRTREKDPFKLSEIGATQSLNLARRIVGDNHPLLNPLQEEVDNANQYVEATRFLLEDTVNRWGETVGISIDQQTKALRNIVLFDAFKFSGLSAAERAIVALKSETWEKDGKVEVSYQVTNGHQEQGVYKFDKMFAHDAFTSSDSFPPYKAIRRSDTPFMFMYGAEMGDLEPYIEQTVDTIAALYNGTDLGLSRKSKKKFPNLGLSDETRKELSRCGCLVLHPAYDKQYFAEPIVKPDDLGAIFVPIGWTPWWIVNGEPHEQFSGFALSQFEHETRHLGDFRVYNGSQVSAALLEARAFCKEIDFYKRTEQNDSIPSSTKWLDRYASILKGNPKYTHVEKFYLGNIKTALARLPEETLAQTAQALSAS